MYLIGLGGVYIKHLMSDGDMLPPVADCRWSHAAEGCGVGPAKRPQIWRGSLVAQALLDSAFRVPHPTSSNQILIKRYLIYATVVFFIQSPHPTISNAQDSHDSYHSNIMQIPFMIEGSLEVKLPTIWTDEKQSRAEAERRERLEERRSEEKESEERRCRCAKR